ncbi:MAG: hypothetical protein ACOXZP_01825 [Minisyncoccales bacterium]|jgi:hypothetical protein
MNKGEFLAIKTLPFSKMVWSDKALVSGSRLIKSLSLDSIVFSGEIKVAMMIPARIKKSNLKASFFV